MKFKSLFFMIFIGLLMSTYHVIEITDYQVRHELPEEWQETTIEEVNQLTIEYAEEVVNLLYEVKNNLDEEINLNKKD